MLGLRWLALAVLAVHVTDSLLFPARIQTARGSMESSLYDTVERRKAEGRPQRISFSALYGRKKLSTTASDSGVTTKPKGKQARHNDPDSAAAAPSQLLDGILELESAEEASLSMQQSSAAALRDIVIVDETPVEPELSAEQLQRRARAQAIVNADEQGKARAAALYAVDTKSEIFMTHLLTKKKEEFEMRVLMLQKIEDELIEAKEYENMSITGKRENDRDNEREDRIDREDQEKRKQEDEFDF